MALERSCTSCGRRVMVPDMLASQAFRCPVCGTVTAVEGPPAGDDAPALQNGETAADAAGKMPLAPEMKSCPACFEPILANAEKCHFCGADPRAAPRRDPLPGPVRRDCEPHRGNLILVMGVVSLVFMPCAYLLVGIVLGAIAWTMGSRDLKKIKAGSMDPEGEGATNAGKICGIVGVVTNTFMAVCMCVYVGAVFGITSFSVRSAPMRMSGPKPAPTAPAPKAPAPQLPAEKPATDPPAEKPPLDDGGPVVK